MKGVTFGNYHSFDDFNLILSQKRIGTPLPKTNVIDIAGGDGVLDLTEYFGDVKYNNRSISFDFSTTVPQAQFMDLFSQVQNALHGQKMRITLDDDPEFYYVGRISISEWKADKSIGKLTIDCDCEPWKWKKNITMQKIFLYGKNLFNSDSFVRGSLGSTIGAKFDDLINTSTTRLIPQKVIYIKPSTKYVMTIPTGFSFAIRMFDKNERLLSSTGWINQTYVFTTDNRTEGIAPYIKFLDDAEIIPSDISSVGFQIEEGSMPTDFEPFLQSKTVDVSLYNMRNTVIPFIKASGKANITFEETTISLNYSSGRFDALKFRQGSNDMTIVGNGAVVFEYQEGGL